VFNTPHCTIDVATPRDGLIFNPQLTCEIARPSRRRPQLIVPQFVDKVRPRLHQLAPLVYALAAVVDACDFVPPAFGTVIDGPGSARCGRRMNMPLGVAQWPLSGKQFSMATGK